MDIFNQSSPIWKPINEIISLLFATNRCEYLPKLYGIWDDVDKIDFDLLPESFALKTNHDGGGIVLVRNKQEFLNDKQKFNQAMKKLQKHLKTNFYTLYREYHYKDIEPKVFAEELLSESNQMFVALNDYKIHTFSKDIFCQVDIDRFTNHTRAIFDKNWVIQNFSLCYPQTTKQICEPQNFDIMKQIAITLASCMKAMRVDMYNIHGRIIIGELTLTHGGGSEVFTPFEWDKKLGDLWQ